MENSRHIKVFISYSWEDDNHKDWIRELANRLISDGIEVTLDQYDVSIGDRLPQFMEKAITNSDYVMIICTPSYKEKADKRESGVGYEGHIISEELMSSNNERKFIPLIRKGTIKEAFPTFLKGKLGINFTKESNFKENYNDLLATLYGAKTKPKIGNTPKRFNKTIRIEKIENNDVEIIGIITDEVTIPSMDGTRGSSLYTIPFRLNRSPDRKWNEIFIRYWNSPPKFTTMHRPGIASVVGDEIRLSGTTIEEVKAYHRDTLILCVEKTNVDYGKILENKIKQNQKENNFKEDHYKRIIEFTDEIKF